MMRVTHLWRYPVKSLAGESLTETRADRGGIPFDRRHMLVDGDAVRKGKPLTARLVSDLLAYRAAIDGEAVRVQAPDGRTYGLDESLALHLQSALNRPLTIQSAPALADPFHDTHDILVLNAASVRALEKEWGHPLNPLRFRPNIMLDGDELTPYVENEWVGRTFNVGGAVLEGAQLDERCVLTTIDPETLARDPSFLRLIVERHDQCFGLYCTVRQPGKIAVGDEWIIS